MSSASNAALLPFLATRRRAGEVAQFLGCTVTSARSTLRALRARGLLETDGRLWWTK